MSFWSDAAASGVGDLGAGAVLAVLLFFAFDVPERRRSARKQHGDRVARRVAYIRVLHRELTYNQEQRAVGVRAIDELEHAVARPLFEVFGASLLATPEAVEALDPELLDELISVYNRMRSANEATDDYAELIAGPTAALVTAMMGNAPSDEALVATRDVLVEGRGHYRTALRARLTEIQPWIDDAIDHLAPLVAAPTPSSHRRWYRPWRKD